MAEKRVIAVLGATGAQGGGLVRAILADPDGAFAVRAITRNADSDKAKALAAHGAEVVTGNLDDLGSLEKAFQDAHGVFAVTNFWEHFSAEKEVHQATNVAEAATRQRVRHVVWSTLEDTRKWVPLSDDRMPTLLGKYKVPHFDGKGEANAEFERRGVPTTLFYASFYWDNLIYFGSGPKRGPDGTLLLTFPMGKARLAGIGAADVGKCAFGVFKRQDEYIGKRVGVASDHLTGDEMAGALTSALGEEVRYNDVPADVYRSFGFPGADDIGNMFQFYRDFSDDVLGLRSVEESRRLNPELQDFRSWLAEHASRIPID